jgi:regulator of replication initiation timing
MVVPGTHHDVNDQDIETAVFASFPKFKERLDKADAEVKDLREKWEQEKEEFKSATDEIHRLRKEIKDMDYENDQAHESISHFQTAAQEAKHHYASLRTIVEALCPNAKLPVDPYDERIRARPKRSRDQSQGRSKQERCDGEEPRQNKKSRPRSHTTTPGSSPPPRPGSPTEPHDDVMDVVDEQPLTGTPRQQNYPHSGGQATIKPNAVAGPSSGPTVQGRQIVSYADLVQPDPQWRPSTGYKNAFSGSDSEEEAPKKAPKGANPQRQPGERYRELLSESSQWILSATGEEEPFKNFVRMAKEWRATEGKTPGAEMPINLAAAEWRNGTLHKFKRLTRTVRRPSIRVDDHYPKAVQDLVLEWRMNPKGIHSWIREQPDGSMHPGDLDVTAWARAIRPKNKIHIRGFRDVLADTMSRARAFEEHECWVGHESTPQPWLVERATSRCPWTPQMTSSELLCWLTEHGGLSRAEALTEVGPYFTRSLEDLWYNERGRRAQDQPAVGSNPEARMVKRKSNRLFRDARIVDGETLTPSEMRQRNLSVNGYKGEVDQFGELIDAPKRGGFAFSIPKSSLLERIGPARTPMHEAIARVEANIAGPSRVPIPTSELGGEPQNPIVVSPGRDASPTTTEIIGTPNKVDDNNNWDIDMDE